MLSHNKRCQLSEFITKFLVYLFPATPQNLLLSVIQQLSNTHLLKVCYSQTVSFSLLVGSHVFGYNETFTFLSNLKQSNFNGGKQSRTLKKGQMQVVDIVTILKVAPKYYPKLKPILSVLCRLIKLQIHRLSAVTSLPIPREKPTFFISLLLAENVGTCTCHQNFPLQTFLS